MTPEQYAQWWEMHQRVHGPGMMHRLTPGSATLMAWHMLFELVNQRGDREAFEQLTMDYALRFEQSPPAWVEYTDSVASRPAASAVAPAAPCALPGVRLPETVDAGIVALLEQLRGLTATHAAVNLDVSDAKSVDLAGASLLLRVIGAFKRSHRELTLVGASPFAGVLARMVESGRRDPSDASGCCCSKCCGCSTGTTNSRKRRSSTASPSRCRRRPGSHRPPT